MRYSVKSILTVFGLMPVFDKGYNDYKTFDEFNEGGIFFVTRLKSNASYESVKENDIP